MSKITIDPRDLARQQIDMAIEHLKGWNELDLASYDECEDRVNVLELLALQDRKQRGLLHLIGNTELPACSDCGERKAIGIEFFDYERRTYPRSKWRLAAQVLCENGACGDGGYFIRWPQLLPADEDCQELQGPTNWLWHLAQKSWFEASFIAEIEIAGKIAIAYGHEMMRRAQLGQAPLPRNRESRAVSDGLRAWVLERDNFRCRRCNASAVGGARLVVDHVVPVAKGGKTVGENLQTLCHPCNSGKRDHDPHPHDLRS